MNLINQNNPLSWLYIFLVVLFLWSCNACSNQKQLHNLPKLADNTQLIFLVRHAEKMKDGTNDPALSNAGKERAENLAKILSTEDIRTIFSTNYERTRSTGMPLARQLGKDIMIYNSQEELIGNLAEARGNVLIIGHSNTIPMLANELLKEEKFSQLEESEYDKLFVLTKVGQTHSASIVEF